MRRNRNIRADNQEWSDFMAHMGTEAFRELCGSLASGKTELIRNRSGVLEIKRKK
jgi:hypothetical protein